jgi:hypothetical protein
MAYGDSVPEGDPAEEITAVIAESMASPLEGTQPRLSASQTRCAGLAQRPGMSPEAFFARFEAGALGAQPAGFAWSAAARGQPIWSRRRDILARLQGPVETTIARSSTA